MTKERVIQVVIYMPDSLLKRIDRAREESYRESRSEWVREAITGRLNSELDTPKEIKE